MKPCYLRELRDNSLNVPASCILLFSSVIIKYVNKNRLKTADWTEEQLEGGQETKPKPVHLFPKHGEKQPNKHIKLHAVQQAHSAA